MSEPEPESKNNSTAALAKVLSQLNLPTLIAVVAMGGGNLFATKNTSDEQRGQIDKAIQQIQELHDAVHAFESRQKESLENQAQLLRGQTISLQNQLEVLKKLEQSEPKRP